MTDDLLTSAEVATLLNLHISTVHTYRQRGVLPARQATPTEITSLLEAGRIKNIAPTGIALFLRADIEFFARRRRQWYRGRRRK